MRFIAAVSFLCVSNAFVVPPGLYAEKQLNTAGVVSQTIRTRTSSSFYPLRASTESSVDPFDTTDDLEKDELLQELQDLTEAFECVQGSIQTNSKIYESRLQEYEDDIAMLKEEIQKQLANVMVRDNDIKELKAIVDNYASKSEEDAVNEEALWEAEEIISNLENELLELKGAMHDKDAERKVLKAILVGKEDELKKKEEEMKNMLSKPPSNDEAVEKAAVLQERVDELEKVLEEKEALELERKTTDEKLGGELQTQINSLHSTIEGKDKEISQLVSSVETLRAEIEGLRTKEEQLKSELENTKKVMKFKVDMWTKDKEQILRDQEKMSNDVERLKLVEEAFNAEKAEWTNTENTMISEMDKLKMENEMLRTKLSAVQAESEREKKVLENSVEKLEEKLVAQDTKFRKEIIDLKAQSYNEMFDLRTEMETAKIVAGMDMDDLRAKIEAYEGERKSLRKLTALGLQRVVSPLRRGKNKEDSPNNGVEKNLDSTH